MSAEPDILITIHWYCGYFVDDGQSHYFDDYPECSTEFDTEDTLEAWREKMCSAYCPSCGAELTQRYDEPQITILNGTQL